MHEGWSTYGTRESVHAETEERELIEREEMASLNRVGLLSKPSPIEYPVVGEDLRLLKEALEIMQLTSLLHVPWAAYNTSLLEDLLKQEVVDQFRDSVRVDPKQWDLMFVADAFAIAEEGSGLKLGKSSLSDLMFAGQRNSRAGWKLGQCVDY